MKTFLEVADRLEDIAKNLRSIDSQEDLKDRVPALWTEFRRVFNVLYTDLQDLLRAEKQAARISEYGKAEDETDEEVRS